MYGSIIRTVLCLLFAVMIYNVNILAEQNKSTDDPVWEGFKNPPMDCRPHTRWWWMGNALRKEDIVWQLDQMKAQGMGGVEQITMQPVYEKGNHEYLSPEYFELLRYAVDQAAERGLEFSVNFGGPGWIWGGKWVPKEKQSKVMLASMLLVEGASQYSGPLPDKATPNFDDFPRSTPIIAPEDRLLKVVAARLENGDLIASSAIDLTDKVRGREISWEVPRGQWQLMAFWLTQRDNSNAVDHLSPEAMSWYCETLGAQYASALGEQMGRTVESFFSDSFEVPIFRNGLYWTDGLLESFRQSKGYDLVPLLPALWWNMDDLFRNVRYDVNEFLHQQGMKAFFEPFLGWCKKHNVKARIQPYGFVTDILEGAGVADLPELEITPGEKDAVPWLDTRIGPREYVASGAHIYGRNVVTAEVFTFMHWEPYRETMEELKIATDGFLRAGANKFYNHGFIASPERDVVPTRGFFVASRVSPENIWWPYYHYLTDYTARSCWMLRQGAPVVDVAIYSPLANQWTLSVLNARKWTREFEWGGVGELLIGNGYAFDLVNDDILQKNTTMDGARLNAGKMSYQVLILTDITAMPLETLKRVEEYVRQGGAVIALERIPEASVGLQDHAAKDAEVQRLSGVLFDKPSGRNGVAPKTLDKGRTFCLEGVLHRDDPLDYRSAPLDPFLRTLRKCVSPDMERDLVRLGKRNNGGLVCAHRRTEKADIYFVSNTQDAEIAENVAFHIAEGQPYVWDARTGERRPIPTFYRENDRTKIWLHMQPFESHFVVFDRTAGMGDLPHVIKSDYFDILEADSGGFTATTERNGTHMYKYQVNDNIYSGSEKVTELPAAFEIDGIWMVKIREDGGASEEYQWASLRSWTELDGLKNFSGRANYSISFDLPKEYFSKNTLLRLSLGVVGNIAEIRLNGKPVGVQWMNGQDFRIEGIARPGKNMLEIEVTNTLINRISGYKDFPKVSPELKAVFGEGDDLSPAEASQLLDFDPLPRSGLLGPVRIIPQKEIRIAL